jgi:hypothetical protein
MAVLIFSTDSEAYHKHHGTQATPKTSMLPPLRLIFLDGKEAEAGRGHHSERVWASRRRHQRSHQ